MAALSNKTSQIHVRVPPEFKKSRKDILCPRGNDRTVVTLVVAAQTICDNRTRTLSEKDVLAWVMQWKQRRKPALDQGEVGLTIRNLAALNWLDVKASSDLPLPAEETVDV